MQQKVNNLTIFLNTRFENSGRLAWLGDKGLIPVRYLFNGKTVHIDNSKQEVKVFIKPSFQKLTSILIKTIISITLLIPGIFLSIFKGFAYLFNDVREKHRLTKSHLKRDRKEFEIVKPLLELKVNQESFAPNFNSKIRTEPTPLVHLLDDPIDIVNSDSSDTKVRESVETNIIENESFEQFQRRLLLELPEKIKNQQINKTYKRHDLTALEEGNRNLPINLDLLPGKIECMSEGSTFYAYNAEGIRDYGWGCAWRAIQTCLSSYNIAVPFEHLFHLFGPIQNLQSIYQSKYPHEKLTSSTLFAPYDSLSGWAEPFIGEMVMQFYKISSSLETVNGIPEYCHAPKSVFHNKSLEFKTFIERLDNHFKAKKAAPIMLDDGMYTFNIIGIGHSELGTTLWIADPHIQEGVNHDQNIPTGLYKITLNEQGKQIKCSLDHEDNHQINHLFSKASYNGIRFDNKRWMVLFPNLPK